MGVFHFLKKNRWIVSEDKIEPHWFDGDPTLLNVEAILAGTKKSVKNEDDDFEKLYFSDDDLGRLSDDSDEDIVQVFDLLIQFCISVLLLTF